MKKITAALLVRTSTNDQKNSIEDQKARLVEWAEAQNYEWRLFVDEGVSGGTKLEQRPAGRELLAAVDEGSVDLLVAVRIDRISRSLADTANLLERLSSRNVGLVLLDLGGSVVDTRSPAGLFLVQSLSLVSQMERSLIRSRVKDAMSSLKARNRRTSYKAPFGFSFGEDDELVKDPDEQEAIQRILALHHQDRSVHQICSIMNKSRFTPRGKSWYSNTVSKIIREQAA